MKKIVDALGFLETSSIAGGVRATDELLKAARVELRLAHPISSGKFVMAFTGNVADVEASLAAGKRAIEWALVDELLLARVHAEVAPALGPSKAKREVGTSLGIVETLSVAATIAGADAAAKSAQVRLLEIGTGQGIGGKGFFVVTGEVASVESAVEAAKRPIEERGYFVRSEVLAGPDPRLLDLALARFTSGRVS